MRKLALLAGALAMPLIAQPRLRPLDEKSYPQVLASHKGNVVLVNFWATWCAPCREEMPSIAALERKYRARGLRLVTVSCDEPEDQTKAEKFLAQSGVGGSAYIKRATSDEKFIDSVYEKWSGALPALFLYDRQGKLARAFIGETDQATLERAVASLL